MATAASSATASPPPEPNPSPAGAVASQKWFYMDSSHHKQGPVTLAELQNLKRSGQVSGKSLVWVKGMAEWAPIATCARHTALTPQPAN